MVWKQGGGNRLAKSLVTLIDDIDQKFTTRDKDYDGTIGDAAHQARKSDHNPFVQHGGQGIVRALDVTDDPGGGFDAGAFAEALRESKDPRILNVIFKGRIFSSEVSPWVWRDRNQGAGDHAHHVHISVVEDPALFDDAKPWPALGHVAISTTGKPAAFPPKIKLGSTGPAVVDLQNLLGMEPTGVFGTDTDQAVRAFQASRNLEIDGIVGTHTWGALIATAKPAQFVATGLSVAAIEQIVKLAADADIGRFDWPQRGVAPRGYIKGMAVTFGQAYAKWRAGDSAARVMAAATNSGQENSDALAWYEPQFRAAGMENGVSGADTLRHLFVLLFGLGMRESSGRYFVGRDKTANNTDADTAEAGLFQMSWNMKTASAEMPRLFAHYSAKPESGFLTIFQEGANPNAADLENVGTGEGVAYQQLCKSCPAFAVESTAVGLRVRRKHWGPITRREVEIRPEADILLRQVQAAVDAIPVVVPERVNDTTGPVVVGPPLPVDSQQLVLMMLSMLSKEKTMDPAKPEQGLDPMQVLLPILLQSMLTGKQMSSTDLLTVLLTGKPAPASGPAPTIPTTPPVVQPQSPPNDILTLLIPLIYERLTGKPFPGTEAAKPVEKPAETPQAAISKPSVQLSAAALAVTTLLQAWGTVGTPFNVGTQPTTNGTLATLIPIATAVIGATGGFGSLLSIGRSLLGGFGRAFGTPK
jgi:hypothetical protein